VRQLIYAALLVVAPLCSAAQWQLDKQTDIGFTLNMLGGMQSEGRFNKSMGTFNYDATARSKSALYLKVDTRSLQIDLPAAFNQLADDDFFKTKTYPYLLLKSRRVHFYTPQRAKIIGELTFMGITQPVLLETKVKQAKNSRQLYFDATTRIKRSDYGITLPIPAVADSIPIRIKAIMSLPTQQ